VGVEARGVEFDDAEITGAASERTGDGGVAASDVTTGAGAALFVETLARESAVGAGDGACATGGATVDATDGVAVDATGLARSRVGGVLLAVWAGVFTVALPRSALPVAPGLAAAVPAASELLSVILAGAAGAAAAWALATGTASATGAAVVDLTTEVSEDVVLLLVLSEKLAPLPATLPEVSTDGLALLEAAIGGAAAPPLPIPMSAVGAAVLAADGAGATVATTAGAIDSAGCAGTAVCGIVVCAALD
jgi:hypothetical protein